LNQQVQRPKPVLDPKLVLDLKLVHLFWKRKEQEKKDLLREKSDKVNDSLNENYCENENSSLVNSLVKKANENENVNVNVQKEQEEQQQEHYPKGDNLNIHGQSDQVCCTCNT